MPRHEYWGRVYEGYGEESEFTSAVASTSIIGFQKQQHGQIRGVAATAKHYLGDGASIDGKSGENAVISEAELRQRYLPPYQAAIDALNAQDTGYQAVLNLKRNRVPAGGMDQAPDSAQSAPVVESGDDMNESPTASEPAGTPEGDTDASVE